MFQKAPNTYVETYFLEVVQKLYSDFCIYSMIPVFTPAKNKIKVSDWTGLMELLKY